MPGIIIHPLTAANTCGVCRCKRQAALSRLEAYDAQVYTSKPDHAARPAYVGSQLAGQILMQKGWNRFAVIWDIAVDLPFRRRGVGRRLIAQAGARARGRELPASVPVRGA